MMRDYLVMYDICDPKRLAKIFKTMKGFGQHLQYSVFQCDLTPLRLAEMKLALDEIINHEADQVLIFDLGPSQHDKAELVEALGLPYTPLPRRAVVI
jgi:CRISPR-associated protein Cas2